MAPEVLTAGDYERPWKGYSRRHAAGTITGMTDASARYRRLSAAFTRQVEAVPPQRWDDPSPCAEWTARQVLDHVIDTHDNTAGYVGLRLPERPTDDPAGAWATVREGMQALLDDPSTAGLEFDGMTGRTTLQQVVDDFVCFDLVVHAWDIARATGGDEQMDPAEVRRLHAQAEGFGDALRGPGVFGPEITPPTGAGEQDRLLAFLGRRP